MSTTLNICKEINGNYNNVTPLISVNFQPSSRRYAYASINMFFYIGAVQDIPNLIFTTEAAGVAYVETQAWTYILDQLNNYSPGLGGEVFVQGVMVTVLDPIQKKLTPQAHIANAATNSPTNAATNAPTDADTNANILSLLTIGTALNSNATKQNSGFTIANANAVKQNTIGTNLNDFAGKFNSFLAAGQANDLLLAA